MAALLLKLALDPVATQDKAPFALFSAAVMVSAWYGGLRAGIFCTLICAVFSDQFFSTPRFSLWVESASQRLILIEFIAEGIIISVLAGALHRTREQARVAARQAESAKHASDQAMSEMQRAQDARKASELRFQTLVEANIIGVCVVEPSGRILEANAAFLDMIGCTREQLAAGECDWRKITPAEFVEADDNALVQIQECGSCDPYEKEYQLANGSRVSILIGATAIDSGGNIICFAADISKHKAVERELATAKEAAEAASEAKSHFLANISHELRTPMNAILGMTELALEEDIAPLVQEYLETVKSSADTLLFLLNDLLDFSRMESGTFELEPQPFDVRETLDKAAKALSLRASEKGLELACYIHSNVPAWVEGDGRRLRQILTNLTGNAIKFTERGEVVISATVESVAADVVRIEFVVTDTGIGIAAEDRARIFAPFTQADASTTRKYSGSGLGLTICRQLIDKMGGRIWVNSTPGEGSRFHCSLPFRTTSRPKGRTEDPSLVTQLRDLPVLVVDDNATNRRILEEMLTNWAMNPTIVEDANRALEELQASQKDGQRYPLVIVDALMPDVDGVTLLEKAREDNTLEGSTVLMLSSADRQVFQDRCDEIGIDNFLEKPISQSDLLDAIMTGLNGPPLDFLNATEVQPAVNRTLRILVAEDTAANQKVVQAILRKRGHYVEIAQNGREAVDLFWEHNFDVILMDVQMPTMDGYQATRVIRESEESDGNNHIPIIAMTAHAMEGDRERCLSAGMDDYISKPIDARNLIRLVERRVRKATKLRPQTERITKPDVRNEPVSIDYKASLARLGGDEDLFLELVQLFEEDAPSLLDDIDAGVAKREDEQVARAAHSLKGLASNFGAQAAIEAALEVETAGRSAEWNGIHAKVTSLRGAISQVTEALKDYQ
ncbi:Hybrid signal transduction histidine kinase J [Durusdinium trenchii]|uniref:Hybrid signal transduction histidine kinase J n=2 Tax=Durusdinium trenchii TaxID=1381693 RepID=A0ABP0QM52_9DINO